MRDSKQVLREMVDAGRSFHVEFDEDEEGRLVLASYVIYPKKGAGMTSYESEKIFGPLFSTLEKGKIGEVLDERESQAMLLRSRASRLIQRINLDGQTYSVFVREFKGYVLNETTNLAWEVHLDGLLLMAAFRAGIDKPAPGAGGDEPIPVPEIVNAPPRSE